MLKTAKLRLLAIFVLSLLVGCSTTVADNTLSSEEKAEGWELLFDGKDMSKWRNFKKTDINPKWIAENGTMTLTGKGGGDILTKKTYKNFDLKLDWNISEVGNSGIFILVDEKGKRIYSHAPEIQILDNERHKDREKPNHRSGSLYDMITSPAESHKVAGEWNSVRILLKDKHLQVWQNDIKTVDVVIHSDKWNTLLKNSKFAKWKGYAQTLDGHIGLQDHADRVSFKNIKIKSLD
ncbi:MAG: DUF1080 domain-containing protein [Lentisphaeraceae bacterium]|nr:DUF1080 domain-containing protein [Lentisphaeraceae bacterium]